MALADQSQKRTQFHGQVLPERSLAETVQRNAGVQGIVIITTQAGE